MGVTIKMAPLAPSEDITPGARSEFVRALREAFGEDYEWTLGCGQIQKLEGLKAGLSDQDSRDSVGKIIETLQKKGTVRVWCVF